MIGLQNHCINVNGDEYCRTNIPTTSVVEEDLEEASEEAVDEIEDVDQEEQDEEDQEEDPNDLEMREGEDQEQEALAEAEDAEVVEESFTNRNVVEGFSGNVSIRQLMNLNLLLKSILFGCLFYILAHPNTRSFVAKNIFKKLKKSQYLYVAMVLFIVVYYVLNWYYNLKIEIILLITLFLNMMRYFYLFITRKNSLI